MIGLDRYIHHRVIPLLVERGDDDDDDHDVAAPCDMTSTQKRKEKRCDERSITINVD